MREIFLIAASIGGATMIACVAVAADINIGTVLSDLNRPCGMAVRHGGTAVRYELFIAESGAGRVRRWTNLSPGEAADAVAGFATAPAERAETQTGPVALLFIDRELLVVAAAADGEQSGLHVFQLAEEDQTLTVADAVDQPSGPESSASSEEAITCHSLTRSRANEHVPDILFASTRGEGGRTALIKSRVQAGVVGAMQPFWSSSRSGDGSQPMVVATSGSGRIVVAHRDLAGDASASRLTFLNPMDASVDLEMPLELSSVVGLAYSPITGRLYAADFGDDANKGGIYRIDDDSQPGQPACRVVKIADVPRPTALAFAPDGTLYVTTFGDADNRGTLQTLTGNL